MVIAAIILLSIAALLGIILLTYVLRNKPTPKGLAFIHGPVAFIAVVVLLVYAVTTTNEHKHWESIILFLTAALGGIILIYRDLTGKSIPKLLAVAHGLIAVTGYVILLYHYFGK